MATSKRSVKRTSVKPAGKKTAATAARAAAKPEPRKAAPQPVSAAGVRPPVAVERPAAPSTGAVAGPTARTCPLVLDGEISAAAFTPRACSACDEFDCRFNVTEEGSGALRSRLFAVEEEEEDGGEDVLYGADFDEEGDGGFGGADEEDDDLF
ncbi:MAG TPA: hypothetical protein PLJ32_00180 [Kiritimatiellia bacterium]|jgi:hypothetical protein|nr:hypothetical protein [Kiritimatiellia bacterium]